MIERRNSSGKQARDEATSPQLSPRQGFRHLLDFGRFRLFSKGLSKGGRPSQDPQGVAFQLPAPLFEVPEGFTRAILFAHKALSAMNKDDRVRACYLHACLRYVTRKPMTNASVRERFGIAEKNAASASRLLNEAVDAGLIVVQDPEAGTRIRTYLPFGAAPARSGEGVV